MSNLMLVIRSIKVAERASNQAIGRKLPPLESTDAHAMAGSPGTGVGPKQCPTKNHSITLNDEIVEKHPHVGKGGHEFLCGLRDSVATHGRSAAINGERAFGRKERGHTGSIPAAPGRSIAPREIFQIRGVKIHT